MRNDRIFKMTRGLSVVASSSLLLLSVVGAASAHTADREWPGDSPTATRCERGS